jgi:hypothetical protein
MRQAFIILISGVKMRPTCELVPNAMREVRVFLRSTKKGNPVMDAWWVYIIDKNSRYYVGNN